MVVAPMPVSAVAAEEAGAAPLTAVGMASGTAWEENGTVAYATEIRSGAVEAKAGGLAGGVVADGAAVTRGALRATGVGDIGDRHRWSPR